MTATVERSRDVITVDAAEAQMAAAAAAERERELVRTRRHLAKARRRAVRRRRRAIRWSNRRAALRLVGPLVLITGCAVLGQVLWNLATLAPMDWAFALRLALSIVVAAAAESTALNVQWHAHDAEINSRHTSAVRLTRICYGIAALVAGVNYSHFAGPDLRPTPAAVVFALFSLASPFLWGLHTRRIRDIRRAAEGAVVDLGGASFLPARWRMYPIRTFCAWRWSIDKGVTDPTAAWVGYHAARDARRTDQAARRAARRAARPHLARRLAEAVIARIEPAAPAPATDGCLSSRPASRENPDDQASAPSKSVVPAAVKLLAAGADTARVVHVPVGTTGRTVAPAAKPPPRPQVDDRTPGRPPAASDDELVHRALGATPPGAAVTKSRFREITRTGGERWERLYDRYLTEHAQHRPSTAAEETP